MWQDTNPNHASKKTSSTTQPSTSTRLHSTRVAGFCSSKNGDSDESISDSDSSSDSRMEDAMSGLKLQSSTSTRTPPQLKPRTSVQSVGPQEIKTPENLKKMGSKFQSTHHPQSSNSTSSQKTAPQAKVIQPHDSHPLKSDRPKVEKDAGNHGEKSSEFSLKRFLVQNQISSKGMTSSGKTLEHSVNTNSGLVTTDHTSRQSPRVNSGVTSHGSAFRQSHEDISGQQYSKREEKFSLSDFIPKGTRSAPKVHEKSNPQGFRERMNTPKDVVSISNQHRHQVPQASTTDVSDSDSDLGSLLPTSSLYVPPKRNFDHGNRDRERKLRETPGKNRMGSDELGEMYLGRRNVHTGESNRLHDDESIDSHEQTPQHINRRGERNWRNYEEEYPPGNDVGRNRRDNISEERPLDRRGRRHDEREERQDRNWQLGENDNNPRPRRNPDRDDRGLQRPYPQDAQQRRENNFPIEQQQRVRPGFYNPGQGHGRNEHRQQNRQHRGPRPLEVSLAFHRLKEMKSKEPAEVLADLSYSKDGLQHLLKDHSKLNSDREIMRLVLSALAKVSHCSSMPQQRNEILRIAFTSDYFKDLGLFLGQTPMTSIVESANIIGESADLMKSTLQLFPSSMNEILVSFGFLDMCLKHAKSKGMNFGPEIDQKIIDLEETKEAAFQSLQVKHSKVNRQDVDEDSLTPPSDFRLISVFPTLEDLDKEELPFLRKNKQLGGYVDLDHYLDVQFRLLREDFVYPLREGIAEYLRMVSAPTRGRKLKDIRLYHGVHLLRAVCLSSGLGHRLAFDVSHMKRVRWEITKRLMYGALVCLSTDNFQTLFFATVTNREPAQLKEGVVDVIFEHNFNEVSAISTETSFIMAETTAFFEAYRHVLTGLQRIRELPFQRYIVHCEKYVRDPSYLTGKTVPSYDLRPLVDDNITLREDKLLEEQGRQVAYKFSAESRPAESVPIFQREEWPDPGLLKLDDSQFDALYRALTKEFSVIQGPPGTGKTYVGLKIVKALLHNRKVWDPELNSSMLIVCYTNHALDQFLEGVVSFFKGHVVRVGSRLKSEEMQKYTLNNLRREMRFSRDDASRDFKAITRLRLQGNEAMDNLRKDIDSLGLKVECAKREILNEDVLDNYMMNTHLNRLLDVRGLIENGFVMQGKTKKKIFCMPEWLGLGAVVQNNTLTPEDLQTIDQELGEDELEIETEVKALEEQHRLDTEDPGERNERKKKERKREMEEKRREIVAVDISRLEHHMVEEDGEGQGQRGQDGQGGRRGGGRVDSQGFQIPAAQWKKIKQKLRRNVMSDDRMSEEEERQVGDLWELDMNQRWRLYRRWTHKLCEALKADLREREEFYDRLARRQQETLMQEDKHVLKTATVIAMTTTAAARYQTILQEVKPKIIVVEEAAEVLEGHVITTLSQNCQHLILIGDHKQLRPNPTVYKLARKYNLELSLFERMINNGIKCDTLAWQHRMRPEIAALVKPIYPNLKDHESVFLYDNVKGISKNLFFVSHNQPEIHDEETKSRSNYYEALYIARLCDYLLKQGYEPNQITVLTTYSGQLFQLKKLMPRKQFDGVRLTVVDNFQGEENDIILLSLVRSNDDNDIGFLKTENRVCVALSRAKIGLYVIGNFDLLCSESELWQKITKSLEGKGMMGDALHLYCQNHPKDQGLIIRGPDDFQNAPEGGCMKPCATRLDCGHVCMRLCHPYDQSHETYMCQKKCDKILNCEFKHRCKKKCFQKCGECTEMVSRIMPKCKHNQFMTCQESVCDFICQAECEVTLVCGHKCGDRCGEPHRCYEMVNHTFPCGHSSEVYCSSIGKEPCKMPCGQQLKCGHQCSGTCHTCLAGRLHEPCKNKCTKILVCGHSCTDTCSTCPPCDHACENRCMHSACTKRCGLPCVPCRELCSWTCPHYSCTKLCNEPCNRPRCNEPCLKRLKCRHPCIGLCGEPCPTLCRICDRAKVTDLLFGNEDEPDARFVQLEDCDHVLEVTGLDHWMETTTSEHEDSIQLKTCPKCKTAIRRNLRYGAIIKQQLKDIEVIKNRMLGDEDRREVILAGLHRMVEREKRVERDVEEPHPFRARFQSMVEREPKRTKYESYKQQILDAGDKVSVDGLLCMENQMKFLEETKKLRETLEKKVIADLSFIKALECFEKWIIKARLVFRQQEVVDGQTELFRLQQWLKILQYLELARGRGVRLTPGLQDIKDTVLRYMENGSLYTQAKQEATKGLLKMMEKEVPESGLGISDQDRVMIVAAMGLSQGHWFKCPNGHIYAIGDCGGASETSRCPECKSEIGGTNHRLLSGNTLAPEMDGARQAAWSDNNNLLYGFLARFGHDD